MKTRHFSFVIGMALHVLLGAMSARSASAQSGTSAVVLDGVSLLVSERSGDESTALPVLLSDVELEASLILILRYGSAGLDRRVDEKLRIEARQRIALIRLLAARARRLNESVKSENVLGLSVAIAERAGGNAPLMQLLSRLGMEPSMLQKWAEDALLAVTQVRYAQEQTEGESGRIVGKWLNEIISTAHLRIVR